MASLRKFYLDTPLESLPETTEAVIVSGGPGNSHTEDAIKPDQRLWEQTKIPTLNICYGMQALALHAGGEVTTRQTRQDGRKTTQLDTSHPLFKGIRKDSSALFTHGDFVEHVPDTVDVIGQHETEHGKVISAIALGNHVGVQFHPEVFDDTPQGYELFGNFFQFIAEMQPDEVFLSTQMARQIASKQAEIRERIGDKHAIVFVSGGVDSVTVAALIKGVVSPEKLHMYYIDNGFMRTEDDSVIKTLQLAGFDVKKIDATEQFEQAYTDLEDGSTVGPLIDTINPKHKRRIIGDQFVNEQDSILVDLGLTQDEVVLVQGTNAADRIESGNSTGGNATEQIKEHHNQVQRVKDLNPLEPLDDLFKDEIRALAVALGLPEHIAYRQPFPGPGTAIRILGLLAENGFTEQSAESASRLQEIIDAFNIANNTGLDARLLPVRSVGVGGDSRTHIQATAIAGISESETLSKLSKHLTETLRGTTNRVVHLLGGGALREIVPIETRLEREVRETLRHSDRIAHEVMRLSGLLREIEQMPVVLLPMGTEGKRSVVLRPIKTRTHMTVQAMLPGTHLPQEFFDTVTSRILDEVQGVSHVMLDITDKPPATTEWE